MRKDHILKTLLIIFCLLLPKILYASPEEKKINELNSIIIKLESTLEEACRDADNNNFIDKNNYKIHRESNNFPDIIISITRENFNQDLEKGLSLLEKYTNMKKSLISKQNKKPKQKKQKKTPARPEDAMRNAERKTSRKDKSRPASSIQVVNIFEDYEKEIKAKQSQADKMAEADMLRINEERRIAEAELKAKEEAEQKVQEQNRRWQNELNDQAEKAAQEALEWKRKYGFGAFVKNIFRTAISGTVSSLTGGIATSLGAGYADILIKKKFPEFTPSGKFDKETNQ